MAERSRILLVEPDQRTAADFSQLLSGRGWTVHAVNTFAQAIDLLAKSAYHVVVMELLLPDMIGVDAWSYMRELYPDLVGIITTSSPSLRTAINAYESGVMSFLLKPQETEGLMSVVEQALQHQHMLAEGHRVERQLASLSNLLSSLSTHMNLAQMLDTALAHFQAVLKPDWAMIYLLGQDHVWDTHVQMRYTQAASEWTDVQTQFVQQLMSEAVRSLRPVIARESVPSLPSHLTREAPMEAMPGGRSPAEVRLGSIVIVPLMGRTETYGAFAVVNYIDSGTTFTPKEVGLVTLAAQSISMALDMLQLRAEGAAEAAHDRETGLYSRAHLARLFEAETARRERYGHPFAMVVVDAASLETVAEGTRAVREMAALLQPRVRSSDTVARVTESQVAVLLPETGPEQAQRVSDRLASAIRSGLERPAGQIQTRILTPSRGAKHLDDLLRGDSAAQPPRVADTPL